MRSIGAATGIKRDVLAAGAVFANIPGLDTLSRYTGTEDLLFRVRKNLFETLEFVARKPAAVTDVIASSPDRCGFAALLTLAVLAVSASSVDLRAAGEALLRLRLGAAVTVLALLAVDRAVMIWRWIILLRARGTAISTKSAAWIYLVSSFVGGFLPAGVGADAARAYTLSQRTSRGSEAVASVAVDRLLGLLSIVVMGTIGALSAGRQVDGPAAVPAAHRDRDRAGRRTWRCCGRIGSSRVSGAGIPRQPRSPAADPAGDAVSQYRGHRAALRGVAGLSVAVQLLRILQAYLLGRGIGIDVPFSYYLLFMPIGLIALLLPISISGIGAPQGIIVWLLNPPACRHRKRWRCRR